MYCFVLASKLFESSLPSLLSLCIRIRIEDANADFEILNVISIGEKLSLRVILMSIFILEINKWFEDISSHREVQWNFSSKIVMVFLEMVLWSF